MIDDVKVILNNQISFAKKCPLCDVEDTTGSEYCEICGTKLDSRVKSWKFIDKIKDEDSPVDKLHDEHATHSYADPDYDMSASRGKIRKRSGWVAVVVLILLALSVVSAWFYYSVVSAWFYYMGSSGIFVDNMSLETGWYQLTSQDEEVLICELTSDDFSDILHIYTKDELCYSGQGTIAYDKHNDCYILSNMEGDEDNILETFRWQVTSLDCNSNCTLEVGYYKLVSYYSDPIICKIADTGRIDIYDSNFNVITQFNGVTLCNVGESEIYFLKDQDLAEKMCRFWPGFAEPWFIERVEEGLITTSWSNNRYFDDEGGFQARLFDQGAQYCTEMTVSFCLSDFSESVDIAGKVAKLRVLNESGEWECVDQVKFSKNGDTETFHVEFDSPKLISAFHISAVSIQCHSYSLYISNPEIKYIAS